MPEPLSRDAKLAALDEAEPYWVARALQEQGSAFFQKIGEALDRADGRNRRLVYETWTDVCFEFMRRGEAIREAEEGGGAASS